ncbi:MAG: hypothetical protein CTY12_01075 [Methylotenera sp.]|nr:MAG: hypothetical protein CTY12_01075 [Methylotenera sp.]
MEIPITSEMRDKPKKKAKTKVVPLTLNEATREQLAKHRAHDGVVARHTLSEQSSGTQQPSIDTQRPTPISSVPNAAADVKPSNTVIVDENAVNAQTKLHRLLAHEIPAELSKRYAIKDHVYYAKNPEIGIVFEDKGKLIRAQSSDADDIRAMIILAKAKNWSSIKVSGSTEFKREAWLEASMQGLAVLGYQPTQQDMALLGNAKGNIQNSIEPVVHKVVMDTPLATTKVKGYTQVQSDRNPIQDDGVLLLAHGKAKYLHNDNNENSYYLSFLDKGTEKTVWGVDLERAITEANANIGDRLKITRDGQSTVTVNAPLYDEGGKVIGTEQKEAQRNAWHIHAAKYRPKAAEVAIIATAKAKGADAKTIKVMKRRLAATVGKLEALGIDIPKPQVYDTQVPTPVANRANMAIDPPLMTKAFTQPQVSPRR